MIVILLTLLVYVTPDLTSTTPIAREPDWWVARTAQLQENVNRIGSDAKVIFIGDSITQGWEGNGAAIWEQTFAPCNAINLGISGDRTEHVLWRMQNGNLRDLAPDIAVVMIGTNNFGQQESDSVAVVLDGVVAVVEQLKKSLPNVHVLLLDIFPRGKSFNAMRGSILQVNQALKATFAKDSRVSFFPIGHLFIEEDGSINPDIMPDYLHLSKQGYQIWADAITPRVRGYCTPGVSDPLSPELIKTMSRDETNIALKDVTEGLKRIGRTDPDTKKRLRAEMRLLLDRLKEVPD